MFINCKKVKIFVAFLMTILFISQNIFSKSKDKTVFEKKVHPRVYEFDLCDSLGKIFLGFDRTNKRFQAQVDITKLIKDDRPQIGDVIKVYYRGYAKKDAGTIKVEFFDVNSIKNTWIYTADPKPTNDDDVLCTDLKKNEVCEGCLTYWVNNNIRNNLIILFQSDKKNTAGVDQVYFHFERVIESTNTTKEKEEEKKALRQNAEIVEVKIDPEEELKKKQETEKAEEEARLKAIAEAEAKRKEEEAAAKKAAELAAAQAAELEKALALASKNTSSYEKEYLSDYMIPEEDEFDEMDVEDELITDPDIADLAGRTLLMKAAKAGNDWQIRTLLNSGAKVNLKDKDGWTALMYAVRYQESLNTVNLLLDAGADIKVLNKFNSSALSLAACYNNNPEILKKLLKAYTPSDKEVLRSFILLLTENHSTEYTQISKINTFIEANVPINNFYNGKTPLMYSCEFGNSTKVIKLLLDNNAVTGLRSTEGKTAYEYASENNKLTHDSTYWELNKK
ncbi:MAG: ankyrin repeat domain-containing protein [Treponema sp.]|nr:ankyrin repeat domain-containing protein [Treponema sp.]